MKYLLNGVAIAAALVIASPVWAQAPAGGATATPAAPAAAAPSGAMPMAAKQMHKRRPMRVSGHHRHHHRHGSAVDGGDSATEQLNRDELNRLQGGGPPAPPTTINAGAGQGGPRASGH